MKLTNCSKPPTFYRVSQGENLSTIMTKLQVSPTAILRNDYTQDFYEGEMVKIMHGENNIHIVKPMQTLTTIAQMYNVKIEDIIKNNNLKSPRLFVGQRLVIKN